MKKIYFSLMALALVVCFTACESKQNEEVTPATKTFDVAQILGSWNVVSYSYIEMNTDADTVLVKDVRQNAGEITIQKTEDESYNFTETFTNADGDERSGEVILDENSFDLYNSSFGYPHFLGMKVKTEGDKTVWESSFTGKAEEEHSHSGEQDKKSQYNTKTEVKIVVTKK